MTTGFSRPSERTADALRDVSLQRDYLAHAEGSTLAKFGDTHVLCAASVEDRVPRFLRGTGKGWVTAEYGMLPRATHTRSSREAKSGKQSGRTQEIQRLIGRSMRAVVDLRALGERTITIDCDVLQADGGTRTAAITGAYVALADAVGHLLQTGRLVGNPLHGQVAAISVGIYRGAPVLDLDYAEDSEAETDMNIVMNDAGAFIELQGTAEGHAFRRSELDELLRLGELGIGRLLEVQRDTLAQGNAVMRIVAATGNKGKLRELRALLPDFELVSQGELNVTEIEETGLTFVENAILKARNAAIQTAMPAIAEDSGLEVDVLDGAPGIYSARYAGAAATDGQNNTRLLAALAGENQRSARFRCVAVVMRHAADPAPLICHGSWEGEIVHNPAGDNGFGYDPLFRPHGMDCTSAELDGAHKNRISHRARALASLAGLVPDFLGHT